MASKTYSTCAHAVGENSLGLLFAADTLVGVVKLRHLVGYSTKRHNSPFQGPAQIPLSVDVTGERGFKPFRDPV